MVFYDHPGDVYDVYFKAPYMRYGPFEMATFLTGCVIVVAIIFSFLCTIGFLADLAEEYPTRAKKVLCVMTTIVLFVHALILLLDRLSLWRSLLSIATNFLYVRLLAGFPRVSLAHPLTLVTIFAPIVETVSWYTFFVSDPEMFSYFGMGTVLCFIVFLLMTPLGFGVALAVEPVGLPGSSLGAASLSPQRPDITSRGPKRTALKALRGLFEVSSRE